MKLDDWKAGKLSPDDPWVAEAMKRGLIQPRSETRKKQWGAQHAAKEGEKQSNDLGEHTGTQEVGPTTETGGGDQSQASGGSQEATEIV